MITMNDLKGSGAKFFGAGGSGSVSWNDLKDRPFYESVGQRVTLSNVENPNWSYNMATIGKGVKLVEGQTCYVSIGTGKVYEFVATRISMSGIEGICIGNPNPNAWDDDYSNKPEFPYNFPFSIILNPENELVAIKHVGIKDAFWPELEEWEENGETLDVEADEIVIKTLDPKFLPSETLIEIIPETQIAASEQGLLPITFALEAPLAYIVEYNDTKYECNAWGLGDGDNMGVGIGNMGMGGMGDDTGEPFLLAVMGNQTIYASQNDATIRVYKKGFSSQQIVTFLASDNGEEVEISTADKSFSECVTAARSGALVALVKYTKTADSYNILNEIIATAYGLSVGYYENGLARNNFQITFYLPNSGDEDYISANLKFKELLYMDTGEITIS